MLIFDDYLMGLGYRPTSQPDTHLSSLYFPTCIRTTKRNAFFNCFVLLLTKAILLVVSYAGLFHCIKIFYIEIASFTTFSTIFSRFDNVLLTIHNKMFRVGAKALVGSENLKHTYCFVLTLLSLFAIKLGIASVWVPSVYQIYCKVSLESVWNIVFPA